MFGGTGELDSASVERNPKPAPIGFRFFAEVEDVDRAQERLENPAKTYYEVKRDAT
jgi:hypothetical protein